jgi:DNA (cytosine-5)-methyltransferase 1
MKHIDLFSGIGGFALVVDTVWPEAEHIFCEIDPFCRQVLKKHWPHSYIHDDIKTFTNSRIKKQRGLCQTR